MRAPNVIFILADDMGYGDFSRFNDDQMAYAINHPTDGRGVFQNP